MATLLDLIKARRRRQLIDVNAEQARLDSATVGSVGAPSGVQGNQYGSTGRDAVQDLLSLSSFAPVVGDAAGLAADIRMFAKQPETRTLPNALTSLAGLLPFIPGMTVFHGSPHKFDAFDMKKIGTGEGAQAYGHGLYFAESPDVAGVYREAANWQPGKGMGFKIGKEEFFTNNIDEKQILEAAVRGDEDFLNRVRAQAELSANKSKSSYIVTENVKKRELIDRIKKEGVAPLRDGHLYTVDLPDEAIEKMLDWDAPLSEQPELMKALDNAGIETGPKAQLYEIQENGDTFAIVDKRRGQYLPVEFRTRDEAEKQIQAFRDNAAEMFKQKDSGMAAYSALVEAVGPAEASRYLKEAGIPGIKYFDGTSRKAGEGTRNFVVFDDKLVKILKRE